MLKSIGIVVVVLLVSGATFYAAMSVMDHLRWWSNGGLGAVFPMLAIAVPSAIAAASLVVWFIIKKNP